MFGPWSIKVVNELDRCSKDAQDMLLTYLDRMRPGHAFLGTTNLHVFSGASMAVALSLSSKMSMLGPRSSFSAFQHFSFYPKGTKGNVRAAMADLEMWMG